MKHLLPKALLSNEQLDVASHPSADVDSLMNE
jgi:hypothetical protein